jgi:hypothetical protein
MCSRRMLWQHWHTEPNIPAVAGAAERRPREELVGQRRRLPSLRGWPAISISSNAMRCSAEALARKPVQGPGPGALGRIVPAEQQQRQHLLLPGLRSSTAASRARVRSRIASCRASGTRPPGAQLPRRIERIASARLHPVACFLRYQRRRHHDAAVTQPLSRYRP